MPINGDESDIVEEYLPAAAPAAPELVPPAAEALTASPYSFEFTDSDTLRLVVVTAINAPVEVRYRMRRHNGDIIATSRQFRGTFDRAINEFEFPIGSGYLLNVTMFASGISEPPYGTMWASLRAMHGSGASATVVGTLVQGYITREHDRAWPGSTLQAAREAVGWVRFIVGTQPAAGTIIIETVPTNARWSLLAIRFALNTDATVADRQVRVRLGSLTANPWQVLPAAAQPAGTSYSYSFSVGIPHLGELQVADVICALPADTEIIDGERITIAVSNIQAGDQFSAPTFAVREWLEPQIVPPI